MWSLATSVEQRALRLFFSSSNYLAVLVGISRYHNCNIRSSRRFWALYADGNFRTHRNTDRHWWALFLPFDTHSLDR